MVKLRTDQRSVVIWLPILVFLAVFGQGCQRVVRFSDTDESELIGKTERYAVIRAGRSESYGRLAKKYLGSETRSWVVEDANGSGKISPGDDVVIPLKEDNPTGVYKEGYQTVPVFSYHRVDNKGGKLSVSPEQLEAQLDYLRKNNYRVIPLADITGFLSGEKALPKRSVVITIDDGYQSAYFGAYPLLKRFGFPATFFVYSDFLNAGGLTWPQLKEMSESNLISIQPHSKTHSNLTFLMPEENLEAYRSRIYAEINAPKLLLNSKLAKSVNTFAYPFGDTNQPVVRALMQNDYDLGLTVNRGGNPFFANPFALRRTMIFGSEKKMI